MSNVFAVIEYFDLGGRQKEKNLVKLFANEVDAQAFADKMLMDKDNIIKENRLIDNYDVRVFKREVE